MVGAARLHQFVVRAALDDAAVLHQQDQIGAADRRQPVRDDERRAPGEQRRHRRLNELLALGVEVARRLVEDQDLRRREDRARDRQPLLLAAESFTPRSPMNVS